MGRVSPTGTAFSPEREKRETLGERERLQGIPDRAGLYQESMRRGLKYALMM